MQVAFTPCYIASAMTTSTPSRQIAPSGAVSSHTGGTTNSMSWKYISMWGWDGFFTFNHTCSTQAGQFGGAYLGAQHGQNRGHRRTNVHGKPARSTTDHVVRPNAIRGVSPALHICNLLTPSLPCLACPPHSLPTLMSLGIREAVGAASKDTKAAATLEEAEGQQC